MSPFPNPPPWSRRLLIAGVTGTNGKTSTATWLAAALGVGGTGSSRGPARVPPSLDAVDRTVPNARGFGPVARLTTLGAFLGDERLRVPPVHAGLVELLRTCAGRGGRAAVLELPSIALASGIATAWPFALAVFTNLTRDHLDVHTTEARYLAAKTQLFAHLAPAGTAVLNACDPAAPHLERAMPAGARALRYGTPTRGSALSPLDVEILSTEVTWTGTHATLRVAPSLAGFPTDITVPAIGEIYVENATAALLAAASAGVPPLAAARAISACPAPPGRFQVIRERPYWVVDYAHSPDALARTLRTARALCRGTLTVVFGAGGHRDTGKRPLLGAAARVADRVIVTSDNSRGEDPSSIATAIRRGLDSHPATEVILDRPTAILEATRSTAPDDVVLIAGRGHETTPLSPGGPPFSDSTFLRELASRGV